MKFFLAIDEVERRSIIKKKRELGGSTPHSPRPTAFFSKVLSYSVVIFFSFGIIATQCFNSASIPELPPSPTGSGLQVAVLIPATGELATLGRTVQSGITLAFDEWNNRGGVSGHHLEWAVFDSGCDFERAQQAVQQALDNEYQFLIGPICSEAAIGAAILVEGANALMISPTATHPLVTVNNQGQTRPSIFRTSYSYELQAQAAARFARETLGVSKAALLTQPDDDYLTGLATSFAHYFSIEGGQIRLEASLSPDPEVFNETLKRIDQSDAELIYLPGTASTANRVASRLNVLEFRDGSSGFILLGSDGWERDELDHLITQNSYFPVYYSSIDNRPVVQDWIQRYKSVYSVEPTTLAALSYVTANMLAAAISQADSFEPATVAVILEQESFETITGSIRFDRAHNPVTPVTFVQTQIDGFNYITSIKP